MRGALDRRGRARRHRAQRRLCKKRARRVRRRRAVHRDRAHAHAVRGGGGFGQRHRDPWRGFRRYVRRRPGPCRRGDRAGGAGGLRAAPVPQWARRQGGAPWHRGRRRDHVPALSRRADAHAQSRISSDRGVRHDGRGRRRRRRARAYRRGSSSMRSAMPARWPAASSNISPKARGPNGFMPAGRRKPAFARRCLAAPDFAVRAPCSKACTDSFTPSRTRLPATSPP